jgi:uncharacterized membrane protein YjjP (DUF1212 family)
MHKFVKKDWFLVGVIILILLNLFFPFSRGLTNFQSWLISFIISMITLLLSFFINERTNKIFFVIVSVFIVLCMILNLLTLEAIYY